MGSKLDPVVEASRRIAARLDRQDFPVELEKDCRAAVEEAAARAPRPLSPEELHAELADAVICTAAARQGLKSFEHQAAELNSLSIKDTDKLLTFFWESAARITQEVGLFPDDLRDWAAIPKGAGWSSVVALVPLYERLLASRDGKLRRRGGVFGTPWSVARFISRSVDQTLKEKFGFDRGIAEDMNAIRFWDPAAGSGIFAAAAIAQARESLAIAGPRRKSWFRFMRDDWLSRFRSEELRLAPWALSHFVVAAALGEAGIMAGPESLAIRWRDALAIQEPLDVQTASSRQQGPHDSATTGCITIVLGNPPYGSLALPGHEWMDRLLRGVDFDGTPRANYHAVDGQPLGERKTWLQDDYVKFLRRAHVEVERAGQGMVCFVTNHGYLDNPTFRGVRRALGHTFPSTSVVDLHGNATRREKTPAGKADQNVFGIETGVAVGLFSTAGSAEIRRGDLWGSIEEKEQVLERATVQSLATTRCPPRAPDYAFVPPRDDHREYDAGIPLHELMPLATSAIVTARDRLAIAFSREDLVARLEELRDPNISDDEIRARYLRSRSPRHAEGNTRGWDLAAARAALRADPDWQAPIIECLYRPFDYRAIYYSPLLVDWSRRRVMEQLIATPQRPNMLALIARRQMPAGQPCNYFWATDRPVVDGVIRSDNRGNETIFPLYQIDPSGERRANFAPQLVAKMADQIGWQWVPLGAGDMQSTFGPYDLAAYIYGLFWTPTYQTRYADALRVHFPRVLLPGSAALFARVSQYGARLLQAHTQGKPSSSETVAKGEEQASIEPGFPIWTDGEVEIAPGVSIAEASPEVWNFRAGAHQVARKWLKDRREYPLSESDRSTYRNILAAIAATVRIQAKLEAAIVELGGFPEAFGG